MVQSCSPRSSALLRKAINVVAALFAFPFLVESSMSASSAAAIVNSATSVDISAHDFSFESIEGGPLHLRDFAGKTILLVNTASECGYTPQYKGLQTLWEQYRDRGLVVLGVPSDDFGGQEPGDAETIKQFCEINYDIDFPMTDKVQIKGSDAHPYYQWVATQGRLKTPRWNFYKHLINGDGQLVDWFAMSTRPDSPKLINAIEDLLSHH